MNYQSAKEMIDGPKASSFVRNRGQKKLQRNTILYRLACPSNRRGPDENAPAYAIRLHSTDVITYYPNGEIRLNSGGFQTVTTKQRMNAYLEGWGVYSAYGAPRYLSGVWFVWPGGGYPRNERERYYFASGIILRPDGTIDPETEGENIEKKVARRRQERIQKQKEATAQLRAGQLGTFGRKVQLPRVSIVGSYSSYWERGKAKNDSNNPSADSADIEGRVFNFPDLAEKMHGMEFAVGLYPKGSSARSVVIAMFPENGLFAPLATGPTRALALIEARTWLQARSRDEAYAGSAQWLGPIIDGYFAALCPDFIWRDCSGRQERSERSPRRSVFRLDLIHRARDRPKTVGIVEEIHWKRSKAKRFRATVSVSLNTLLHESNLSDRRVAVFHTPEEAKLWTEVQIKTAWAFRNR